MDDPLPVHVIPSTDVAIEFVPEPTATHKDNDELHVIPRAIVENIDVPLPVQLIPSTDVAIEFVPEPTATHKEPFHATAIP
jgi:hypothetical protein